jgi:phage shock protein A
MGFFKRMGVMVRGFFGLFAGKMEEKNPDALFEDIKNQIEKSRKLAEQQIIDIQTNAEMIRIELRNSERSYNAVKSRIETAQRQGDKDLLIELLIQEEECQANFEAHKSTFDNAMKEVSRIREDFRVFEAEMNNRLNEIRSLKSQAKMAYFKENINSMNAAYTSRNNKIGSINNHMERAREIVNKKTARANAIESLNDVNMDLKFKRLDMDSARERARIRAEAMLNSGEGFEVRERIQAKAK